MIECKRISASYEKSKEIIKDLSIMVENGKILVLLGNNGSGKTTLLRAINGEISVRGDIFIDGISQKELKSAEKAKNTAILPQILPIPSGVTVREAVAFGRTPYTGYFGKLSVHDNEMIDGALERAGITRLQDKYLTDISGGERQKAFLAMLIAKGSKNIILDEPTSNLDSKNKRELFEFMREMKKTGHAILAVLHDLNDAISVADTLCVMADGKIEFYGDTDSFIKSDVPQRHFGSNPIVADENGKKRIFFI